MKPTSFLLHLTFLFFFALLFTQCSGDEEEIVVQPDPVTPPTASISHTIPSEITEGNKSYEVKVTLDKATPKALSIPISVGNGGAVKGEDFDIGSAISIGANQTSGTVQLKILDDCIEEEVETIALTVGDATSGDVKITAETINTSIANAVSDVMTLTFEWSGSVVEADGTTSLFCDGDNGVVDIDIWIIDSTYEYLDINEGASYTCPEVLTLSPDSIDNGMYYIIAVLYMDPYDDSYDHSYPITVTAEKCGGIMDSFLQQEELQLTAKDKDWGIEMEPEESISYISGLIVQDGVYRFVEVINNATIIEGLRERDVISQLIQLREQPAKRNL